MGVFNNAMTFLIGACLGMSSVIISIGTLSTIPNSKEWDDHRDSLRYNNINCAPAPPETLPPVNVPKFQIAQIYQDEHDRIDQEDVKTRCDRYDLKPYEGPKRRIFYGATIADDNWEIFQIHAVEAYGVYDVAAFVESNTTFMATPRKLRFNDTEFGDLLAFSEMLGPNTNTFIDFWLEDWPDLLRMDREAEQRNAIAKRWKAAGMTPQDVGLHADIDEVVSRDFLRALQTCDFPELRPSQTCHRPKIVPSTISFEMTPYCIKKKTWFHPDIISGQCVEGIGDPTGRVVPLRSHKGMYGERHFSFGKYNVDNYSEAVHISGRYPLFSIADIRTVHADRGSLYNFKDLHRFVRDGAIGIAYHFHNWFTDLEVLRHKYLTYGHADEKYRSMPLSQIYEDLELTVRCIRRIGNPTDPSMEHFQYFEKGRDTPGPRPIFFLNTTYTNERDFLARLMVLKDERKYGSVLKDTKKKKNRKPKRI